MLLPQISPSDPVTNLVVEELMRTAPILNDVQFYASDGGSALVKYAREGETPASIFRSLNEDNTATAPTPVESAVAKRIVSFDAKVDVILEDRNQSPEAELAHQTRLKTREAGWILQEKFFEADNAGNGEEFDGFRALVDPTWVLEVAANGIVLQLGNSDDAVMAQQVAMEELLKLKARVRFGATHFYMNSFLHARILTVAKHLGYYRLSKDELGNEVETIGDVILRSVGLKKNGDPILPFTETVGGASNCSSIFAARWGERVDLTALTSVGVKARYAGQIGNMILNNVNMDMTLVLQDPTALVQSKGWRVSAS